MPWITTEVEVEVDMDEFDDEVIREEYESRGLGDAQSDEVLLEQQAQLLKAYQLHHDGKKDLAYEILWEFCLDKLNKVV